jgi:hypothetical protein
MIALSPPHFADKMSDEAQAGAERVSSATLFE